MQSGAGWLWCLLALHHYTPTRMFANHKKVRVGCKRAVAHVTGKCKRTGCRAFYSGNMATTFDALATVGALG